MSRLSLKIMFQIKNFVGSNVMGGMHVFCLMCAHRWTHTHPCKATLNLFFKKIIWIKSSLISYCWVVTSSFISQHLITTMKHLRQLAYKMKRFIYLRDLEVWKHDFCLDQLSSGKGSGWHHIMVGVYDWASIHIMSQEAEKERGQMGFHNSLQGHTPNDLMIFH